MSQFAEYIISRGSGREAVATHEPSAELTLCIRSIEVKNEKKKKKKGRKQTNF